MYNDDWRVWLANSAYYIFADALYYPGIQLFVLELTVHYCDLTICFPSSPTSHHDPCILYNFFVDTYIRFIVHNYCIPLRHQTQSYFIIYI